MFQIPKFDFCLVRAKKQWIKDTGTGERIAPNRTTELAFKILTELNNMRQILTKLSLSIMMVIASHQTIAADYYFSSVSGDDSRTETQARNPNTPWKSIEKLNEIFRTLKPGDAVYFKRGEVFYGTVNINKSGAAGNPIKIGAYGEGAKPVITSLVALNGWKSVAGGRFEAKVPQNISNINILLMNNSMLELGRYPNADAENEGYLTIDAVSGNNMISGKGVSGSASWKGGDVVIKKNQWVIDVQKIKSHSGSSLGFENGSTYPPRQGWGFFIQNHLQTVDRAGEWYFDPSSKKMYVHMGGKQPSSYKFEATTLDHLLTKTYGASYIQIDNIHFKGSNSDAIYIAGGKNISFRHIDIENAGGDGIKSLSVIKFVFENSKVTNTYNNGISLNYGNESATIRHNVVENVGNIAGRNANSDGNGIGILAKSDDTVIEKNVVRNTGYSGIHFGGNNSVVRNNFVENFVLIKGDGGGVYSFDGASSSKFKNRKIVDNIIVNARGSWGGVPKAGVNFKPLAEGIFLDDNSSGIEIAGNTVAHATNNTLKMSNVSDIIVRDNTFFDGSSLVTIGNNDLGRDTRGVKMHDNIFFSKYADQSSYRINTRKNDVKQLAEFNNNYFFRPFGDEFSIVTRYQDNSGVVEKQDDRERWYKSFGFDKDSKSHVVSVEKFNIIRYVGKNLFSNGAFNTNVRGINPSGGEASWSSNKISGGTLQMVAGQKSSILIEVGNIKKGKAYSVEFKGLANKKSAIRAFFRYHKSPWEQVSASTTFELTPTQASFKTVLSPYEDVEGAVLIISAVDPNFTFWMDDLEIREVELEKDLVDQNILFEYNTGNSPKTIQLDGTYVDAKKKEYSGSVTIPSYGSIVLVKISQGKAKEEVKVPAPEVQLVLPSGSANFEEGESMVLKANVSTNGATIKKVNFYNGLNIIGSSSKAPYQITWNKLPKGEHYIWASAIDDKNSEVTSKEIDIKVLAAKVTAPEKDEPVAQPATGMYFNTTGNVAYTYNNREFERVPAGTLKTSGTNVSTNATVSKAELFQKGRFAGSLTYAIPVPNGTYTVETYHMETHFGKNGRAQKAGQRVFDISIEGKVVRKDFDMFLENGNKETVLTFKNIVVKDGVLNLELTASANNAIISGVAIIGTKGEDKVVKDETSSTTGMYFNTTGNAAYTYNNREFERVPAGTLKTSGTNVSTNATVSKAELFQKGRFAGSLTYAIPVPNGTYTVETYHMETHFGKNGRAQKAGQRVFDISIEGKVVRKDFDMFLENGNKETVLTFKNIVVKDGVLNLELIASANNATISGVAIIGTKGEDKAAKVETSPTSDMYFNTTGNATYAYNNREFEKIPAGSLKTSGTNVSTNATVSKAELFQKGRFAGSLTYAIPVPNGTYTVETYHMETHFGKNGRAQKAGQRVFDISIEGKVVRKDFDMFLENGNKETVLTFKNIVVKDGVLNLELIASANNATISGVAIKSAMGSENLRVDSAENTLLSVESNDSIQKKQNNISLYPNPASSQTTLAINVEVRNILIHNINGQLITTLDPSMLKSEAGKYVIPLSNLSQGLYLVTIVGERGFTEQVRLLVTP